MLEDIAQVSVAVKGQEMLQCLCCRAVGLNEEDINTKLLMILHYQ